MATYLTDEAICLRVTDFSETSQIVALFTRRHGLVPLIAKGSKRNSKKNTMSGPLDLLTSGEVVFVPAREQAITSAPASSSVQLGTLAGWDLANHRRALRSDYAALSAAMLFAEVTTSLVQPHDPHEDLFPELEAGLDLLTLPAQRARTAVAYVKAVLLSAGYWPSFALCLACGRTLGDPDAQVRFSPLAGGILCADCRLENSGKLIPVAARIAVALDRLPLPTHLLQHPPERTADEAALSQALALLLAQVELLAGRALRTRYVVSSIFVPTRPGEHPRPPAVPPPGSA
jgi:DNA repair protein RecO (recombination protein O)